MSNETTRRNAESRRNRKVAEIEQEPVASPPAVDEDAAAFLQEAAEAAAAAALEAEALATEIDDDTPAPADAPEEERVADAAESLDTLESLEAELAADAAEEIARSIEETVAPAHEPLDLDEEIAAAEAAVSADDALDAEIAAAEAAVDAAEAAAPSEEDRALEAEMVRELSEAEPTPEEEALAQAEAERDADDELPADIAESEDELSGSFEKIAAKARRLSDDQARHVIHSVLFVADKPISVEQIRGATGLEPPRIREQLERLSGDLREGISGVVLSEVSGGWQLRTAPESAEFVRRFLHVKPRRLTRAALETLAIIAYRQPVTRPEIEDIRGVDCGAVVKALLDWKLIKILGKKDEVGRPLLYGTSREFLEFFQLKDLASLPTLREFHELNEESVQIVEEELGPEAAASIAGTVAELTDPAYLEAERERVAKSEQALADLEQALADAEAKSRDVSNTINPPKETEEEVPPETPPDAGSDAAS